MIRNRLYLLLFLGLIVGYGWLAWFMLTGSHNNGVIVCPFKKVTGIPCPSCGSTRAVASVFHGHIYEAVLINPLGLVLAAIMVIAPIWLVHDLLTHKQTLYNCYRQTEKVIRIKWVAAILITLIIANWIWNIQKEL